jgi:hypothetical protein
VPSFKTRENEQMDMTIRRDTDGGATYSEKVETGVGDTPPKGSRGHLHLVPEPEAPATIPVTADGNETTTDDGLASVTYLYSIPTEKEHDGAEGKDRVAAAPEAAQGARPWTDGELEEQEDEEDLPRQVAAVLPVPRF